MRISSLVLFIICMAATSVSAQSECQYYHKKFCENKDGMAMKYDSQSKSAILGKGQISEFHMVAYGGLDYRITLCAEENLGSQVQFKIYEKQRVLLKDNENTNAEEESNYEDAYSEEGESEDGPKFKMVKELLYDNASDNYSNTLEFTADGSMSLIIEVIAPGDAGGNKLKIREMGCVGVLIEHVKSRNAGF